MRLVFELRWPAALVVSTSIMGWVIATDDDTVLKGPVRVQLLLDQPLPIHAELTSIREPIRTQPMQASVVLPQGVRLAAPFAVDVPQLKQPLRATVDGAVTAQVNGAVAADVSGAVGASLEGAVQLDGPVQVDVTQPLKHERIRLGL